ncbi:thermonuclease family protein [Chitinimonas viridis]|uniref:Thermonuclease family protein n=1 Tax=Chitinimonas viridis TaxID=664880 RepID=A0ABT8B695_9NEIS|nr:thermonuclease family protein [Chitinimonas viridis]MDN3577078.1 thermonuclease family protein [Chitinimonas viridis]
MLRYALLAAVLLVAAFAEAKNCTKGKPCGKTCIAMTDTCRIGNPGWTLPGAPSLSKATAGDRSATLTFSPPSYAGGGSITGYTATCYGTTHTAKISGTDSPLVVSNLVNGTAYYCSVSASNWLGSGLSSSSFGVTPTAPPTVPAALSYSHDGDTLIVQINGVRTSVRLQDIDAPELSQPWGKEAKTCLDRLITNRTLSVGSTSKDRYGRTLATVYVDGLNLNLELVKQGCAWLYREYSSEAGFDAAEQAAKLAKLGLWAQLSPTAPWDYRRAGNAKTTVTFTWASIVMPEYFSGSPTIDSPIAGAERWQFPLSKTALASYQGRVYVMGSLFNAADWMDVGALDDYAAQADLAEGSY